MNKFPWSIRPKVQAPESAVVIGAGLAGISVAFALARRGVSVTLLERGATIAEGSSGNPAGLLMPYLTGKPMPISDYYTAGFDYTRQTLNLLEREGFLLSGSQSGLLYLSTSPSLLERHLRLVSAHPDRVTAVDQNEASHLAGVAVNVGGLWLKDAGWLVPHLLCAHLKEAAGKLLTLQYNSPVKHIELDGQAWSVQGENFKLKAEVLVIANAEDATSLLPCKALPITRAPGQLTIAKATRLSSQLQVPLCADGYVLPAHCGEQVIGATFRQANDTVDEREAEHLQNFKQLREISLALLEGFKDAPYKGRVAVRAVTPDHLPIVGPLTDPAIVKQDYQYLALGATRRAWRDAQYLPNLYASIGHGARGLSSCLLAGEIIAALMHNEALPVEETIWRAIHPSRFYFRSLCR